MESQMNSNMRVWIILVTVIIVAFLAAFWAVSTIYRPQFPQFPERSLPHAGSIPGDIEFFYIAQTVVSTINVALLVFLIVTYVSIYRKTRSEFTIGLLVFSVVFLMKDLAANPLVIQAFGFRPFGLGPFAMLPDLFEFVALSVLLYLSIKY